MRFRLCRLQRGKNNIQQLPWRNSPFHRVLNLNVHYSRGKRKKSHQKLTSQWPHLCCDLTKKKKTKQIDQPRSFLLQFNRLTSHIHHKTFVVRNLLLKRTFFILHSLAVNLLIFYPVSSSEWVSECVQHATDSVVKSSRGNGTFVG